MKRLAFALVALTALPLTGCGFTPLYAVDGPTSVTSDLAQVSVMSLKGPAGPARHFDHALAGALPNRAALDTRYQLAINLKEQRRAIAVTVSANTRRFDYFLFADYILTDGTTGAKRKKRMDAVVSYGVVESQYASLVGREDAERRAAEELARKVELDIALFLKGRAPVSDRVDLPDVFSEELIEGGLPEQRATGQE